ncbi:MAG: ATP-dependent DNA ligase [Parachlamydia sp.]|nr:ATP-dependent DNA ligase [Parachlamydia sp.]
MRNFIDLIKSLDSTTSTNEKVDAIARYFRHSQPQDAVWGLFFLTGNRFKRLISSVKLREWCQELAGIPDWLFIESYARVGDSAEVIALLLPSQEGGEEERSLGSWMAEIVLPLKGKPEEEQKSVIVACWKRQSSFERFIMNKILMGNFRIGVSTLLTIKGLSQAFDIPVTTLSLRLSGEWTPTASFFSSLISKKEEESRGGLQPYPFFLASPLESPLSDLGSPEEWAAEWKWDGIRAQIICRGREAAIWSRSHELITPSFPELLTDLPESEDFILDGEILAFEKDKPRHFADLQKRLSRKIVTPLLQTRYPVAFMIYDLLEWQGKDKRQEFFLERREFLTNNPHFFRNSLWKLSPLLPFESWEELQQLRAKAFELMTEGIMLKRKNSAYGIGRKRGDWWKYKVDSMTVDAVLIYAQPGSGYRSGLYTDYTFGVWDKNELVPIAKAYSGLTQQEIKEVDRWIRQETLEKYGPVRKVKPFQVFELAFENIQISGRHKSGIALRFPRIKRWRKDKTAEMADTLDSLKELLKSRMGDAGSSKS